MDSSDLTPWVEKYTDELYRRALYKVNDPELAKDLVQETFLAAVRGVGNFRSESSPLTWLHSILNRKIVDYFRSAYRKNEQLEGLSASMYFDNDGSWRREKMPANWGDEEPHLLDNEEFLAILKKCFDLLPEKWSTCMKLRFFMNKRSGEICQELDLTSSNLWQIMHRAKLKLRDCVETNWIK